jgi:hypothetical protein
VGPATLWLGACALIACYPLQAQQPGRLTPEQAFLLPPGEFTIESLVELASHRLHCNFLLSVPKETAASRITLTEPLGFGGENCQPALEAALSVFGLAVVALDAPHGLYEIVSMYDARAAAIGEAAVWVGPEAVLAQPHGKQWVTTFIPLQHVAMAPLVNALRSLNEAGPGICSAFNVGLVLHGARDQVAQVLRIVRECDQPGADSAELRALMDRVAALTKRVAELGAQVTALQPGLAVAPDPAADQASASPVSQPPRPEQEPFRLAAGTIPVAELVARAAGCLHWRIVCEAKEIGESAPFRLFEPMQLDAAGCEDVLGAMLSSRGLAVVPMGPNADDFEVLAIGGNRGKEAFAQAERLSPEAVLQHPGRKRVVTARVPMVHMHGNLAVNFLRPFFENSQSRTHIVLPPQQDAHAVTVTGFQDQVATAIHLLQACDRPVQAPTRPELEQRIGSLARQAMQLQERVSALHQEAGK